MNILKPLFMSMGMFSILPVPKNSWNDKFMHLVIVYFPIVGMIIGLIWYGISLIITNSFIPVLIQSSILLLVPFVLSGFLHIDGFMDTSDAIFSRRSLEEKRKILKDSNVGAFATIALVSLFILQFSAVYILIDEKFALPLFVFIPMVSRCTVSLGLLNLPSIWEQGYMSAFKANTKLVHSIIIIIFMITVFVIGSVLYGKLALISLLTIAISGVFTMRYVYKQLQGLSGDLCGYVLTFSECCGLMCIAILSNVEVI